MPFRRPSNILRASSRTISLLHLHNHFPYGLFLFSLVGSYGFLKLPTVNPRHLTTLVGYLLKAPLEVGYPEPGSDKIPNSIHEKNSMLIGREHAGFISNSAKSWNRLHNFEKTTNCTRPTGSCNLFSLWKQLLALIYSKLHSKPVEYLHKSLSMSLVEPNYRAIAYPCWCVCQENFHMSKINDPGLFKKHELKPHLAVFIPTRSFLDMKSEKMTIFLATMPRPVSRVVLTTAYTLDSTWHLASGCQNMRGHKVSLYMTQYRFS